MPFIIRLPALNLMDDGPGKPVGIYEHIGKKPVFAAGNSDDDYQMLQWASSNALPHMEIIVHHTDLAREYKYDRGLSIGKLEKGLDDAPKYDWVIVDMQKTGKKIYQVIRYKCLTLIRLQKILYKKHGVKENYNIRCFYRMGMCIEGAG